MLITITEKAAAGQTVFNVPTHDKTATAKVNGSNATIASQADTSITLQSATAAGDTVDITINEVGSSSKKIGALFTTNVANGASGTTAAINAGAVPDKTKFNAQIFADKNGTLIIEASADNTTFREVDRKAVTASQGATLTTAVTQQYYRAKFTNTDAAITTIMWLGTSLTPT